MVRQEEGLAPAGAMTESGWRARFEGMFERWGRFVIRRRWPALIVSLLATGWLASFLPGLEIDNSTESFFTTDDPAVLAYNVFRDQFGRDDKIVIAVAGGDLFDLDFLEKLRALHESIEAEVPYVSEVESLVNARYTRGEAGQLVVGELLEEWPEGPGGVGVFERRVRSNPLYQNALVSSDYSVTGIVVTPDTFSSERSELDDLAGFADEPFEAVGSRRRYLRAEESNALISRLYAVLDRFEGPGFRSHMAGALPMTWRIDVGMKRDFQRLLPITVLVMGLVLGALFRRVGGVILPLLVVLLSLVASFGIMILLRIPGSTVVQILPVFLLTVGICDAVHILALAYRFRMAGREREDSIALALGHSGLAVLMTSVTTAVGMMSFVTSEMAAARFRPNAASVSGPCPSLGAPGTPLSRRSFVGPRAPGPARILVGRGPPCNRSCKATT